MTSKLKKTKGSVVTPRVQAALIKLGGDIALARRARRMTAEDLANRAKISRSTLHRLEAGDPGVSLHTLAMTLSILGQLELLRELMSPESDDITMLLMRDEIPQRVRSKRNKPQPDEAAGKLEQSDPEEPSGW